MMTEQEFWSILANMPEPRPVFFRLYYDETGAPIVYSMEDLPGNYIDIDSETFAVQPQNVRVVDKKLTIIEPRRQFIKLVPAGTGTACDPNDVAIIVSEDQPHTKWSLTTNESN